MDTRFSFCAIAALRLLNRLESVDVAKATDFVLSCKNFDGGFGVRPGSETHAGQIYCCLGFLAITGNLHMIDPDQLGELGLENLRLDIATEFTFLPLWLDPMVVL